MQVEVVPLSDFVHGGINAHQGRPQMMEAGLAGDLERAGLVRIKLALTHANKMPPDYANKEVAGKAADAGAGQPSSSSPAAQASPTGTLHLSKAGDGRRRKTGT